MQMGQQMEMEEEGSLLLSAFESTTAGIAVVDDDDDDDDDSEAVPAAGAQHPPRDSETFRTSASVTVRWSMREEKSRRLWSTARFLTNRLV
mmetsp:Transcript_9092/g.22250  ORF Transcript_9092/g.22250 Transcript_9092/m.22250 type:complete len:91 (+) Transcript_9092:592-864(+)